MDLALRLHAGCTGWQQQSRRRGRREDVNASKIATKATDFDSSDSSTKTCNPRALLLLCSHVHALIAPTTKRLLAPQAPTPKSFFLLWQGCKGEALRSSIHGLSEEASTLCIETRGCGVRTSSALEVVSGRLTEPKSVCSCVCTSRQACADQESLAS